MMPRVLRNWNPEDTEQWESTGKAIAKRNLWVSVFALLLAFVVWQIWSVIIVKLPSIGFNYDKSQLFLLASLPALSGATLRIFYSFAVPIFGGRRWTALSTASLLIPVIGIGICVQNPETSFSVMVLLALLCGFGGANFSSSMSNISFFFPQSEKGGAMGVNAGLGNLGVSVVQLVVPIIILFGFSAGLLGAPQEVIGDNGVVEQQWVQNAAYVWIPFIVLATLAAWFFMNDVASAKASFKDQMVIFKRKHNWLMCWLYIGTFGSFIGFSAAFPMLTGMEFPAVDPLKVAFLGPLIGALTRVFGGILADKLPASKVTQYSFIMMILAVLGVLLSLPKGGSEGHFAGFLISFIALFAFAGAGNGSTFAQTPRIFNTLGERASKNLSAEQKKAAKSEAVRESAAIVGFMGAIGAYGGFIIPKAFGSSLDATGSPAYALWAFIIFYLSCIAINWWFYVRKNAEVPC